MKRKNDVEDLLRRAGKTIKEVIFIAKDTVVEFRVIGDASTIAEDIKWV